MLIHHEHRVRGLIDTLKVLQKHRTEIQEKFRVAFIILSSADTVEELFQRNHLQDSKGRNGLAQYKIETHRAIPKPGVIIPLSP